MGVHVLRPAIGDQGFFRLAECNLQRGYNLLRDVVLNLENVREFAVVALGPEVPAARGFDELGGNANPVTGLTNTAFEGELNAEFAAYVWDTECLVLVDECRIARDDEQSGDLAEVSDDILRDAVTEVLLFGIAAHVVKGKDNDRWFVRGK